MKKFDIYLVTDSTLSKSGIFSDVANAIRGGCKIIQYREKSKSFEDAINEAKKIRELCKDTLFIVNDRIDVALAVNADGVHIGQDDITYEKAREILGDKIIGVTVHNVNEAIKAEKNGVDYVGLGPIFKTDTKKDAGESCGLEMIKRVRKAIKIPIVAIGGISKGNISDVIEAGADSAAVVSAIVCSNDVYVETRKFVKIIDRVKMNQTYN